MGWEIDWTFVVGILNGEVGWPNIPAMSLYIHRLMWNVGVTLLLTGTGIWLTSITYSKSPPHSQPTMRKLGLFRWTFEVDSPKWSTPLFDFPLFSSVFGLLSTLISSPCLLVFLSSCLLVSCALCLMPYTLCLLSRSIFHTIKYYTMHTLSITPLLHHSIIPCIVNYQWKQSQEKDRLNRVTIQSKTCP